MRLLAQVRRTSRRRQEEPTDWYSVVLGVAVLAGFPIQVVIGLLVESGRGAAVTRVPFTFAVGVGILIASLGLVVAIAVGPLRATPSEFSWVFSGPVERRSELAPRWIGTLLTTGLAGAVFAAVGAVLAGVSAETVALVGFTGAGFGVFVTAAATCLQAAAAAGRRRVQSAAFTVALAGLAVAGLFPDSPRSTGTLAHGDVGLGPLIGAVAAGAAAVVFVVRGWRSLPCLDRVALTAGNAVATAVSAAVLFLDPALLGGVLSQRQAAQLRVARSWSFPTGRVPALLVADWLQAARNRRAIAVFLAALLGPYAAAGAVAERWVPVVALGCAVAAISPLAAGLRQICRSPALRRNLGGSDRALRLIHLALPAAAVLIYTAGVAPAVPATHLAALALVPVGVLVNVWLRATGKPIELGAQIADTGFGPLPIELAWFLIRGIGPLAVVVGVQLSL